MSVPVLFLLLDRGLLDRQHARHHELS